MALGKSRLFRNCAHIHPGSLLDGEVPLPPFNATEAVPGPASGMATSTAEEPSKSRIKRGIPNVRWRTRGKLDATTLAQGNPDLVQITG